MSLSVRMYINVDALSEDDTYHFRGMPLSDRELRPYVYAHDAETAALFSDVTIAVSGYDNMIIRVVRILGEYSLESARGILTLCDSDDYNRYHIVVTGDNYSDVVALYRAVRIGSILPDVSYDESQMKDPAAVKLEQIRKRVREHFDREVLNNKIDSESLSFYEDIDTILNS